MDIFISIVFYMMGLLCFISFEISPIWCCMINGITQIIHDGVKIIGYLSNDLYCLAFQFDLASGILLIVSGLIAIGYNQSIYEYLLMGLGTWILLNGLLKIQISKDAKVFGLKNWGKIFIFAILSGIFGFLILIKSFSKELLSHIMIGCVLLLEDLMNQYVIHYTVKNQIQRIIY